MNCIVTAGPTFEGMDHVRRLTNFATGRLGTELSNQLVAAGHSVTLLIGEQATYRGERRAQRVETFTTAAELSHWLQSAGSSFNAVFHTAAVCDFSFGKVWQRSAHGELVEVSAGKISSHLGTLLAELVPTPKIIGSLRSWFPQARLIGWKYEVDGARETVIEAAEKQIRECLTDACVANGPAYGDGFGLVTSNGKSRHLAGDGALFEALAKFIASEK